MTSDLRGSPTNRSLEFRVQSLEWSRDRWRTIARSTLCVLLALLVIGQAKNDPPVHLRAESLRIGDGDTYVSITRSKALGYVLEIVDPRGRARLGSFMLRMDAVGDRKGRGKEPRLELTVGAEGGVVALTDREGEHIAVLGASARTGTGVCRIGYSQRARLVLSGSRHSNSLEAVDSTGRSVLRLGSLGPALLEVRHPNNKSSVRIGSKLANTDSLSDQVTVWVYDKKGVLIDSQK